MPTTDQLMVTIAAELEFPSMRRLDDPMYVPPTKLTGQQLSEIGQQLALTHANERYNHWGIIAYKFLKEYVKMYGSIPFQAEDVRSHAEESDFPLPPHARAWGSIFSRAAKEGVIKSLGRNPVKNPKAHCAYSNMWVRI